MTALNRSLLIAGLTALALRLWIAIAFPITGDEAFFYWWGVYPDWGYYDHPPMVGWLIAASRWLLGDSLWAIRLPVVLLPLALGGILWWAFAPLDRTRAAWAVLFIWLAPINWLNVFITTDTPLIFWSVLSVACLYRAEQRAQLDRAAWSLYALAGLALTGAFLSKYFSVVLVLAYLGYFALYSRKRWLGLVLLLLCALPGPLINFSWNMFHGWSNIMFNLYNRNQGEVWEWRKPALYAAMWLYLLTPVLAWLGWKHRRAVLATVQQQRLLSCMVMVPLLFFALLSMKKVIGLHWVLSFYPFTFVLAAFALPKDKLKTCALGLAAFTALHVLVVAGLFMTHLPDWKNTKIYSSIVRSYRTAQMLEQVRAPGVTLMATAYTPASIYGFEARQYIPVFGVGRFHARQDDLLVDFSNYRGKTIRIISIEKPELSDYQPYFQSVRLLSYTQDDLPFYAVEGEGFDDEAYRRVVLGEIFQRFYGIPAWLPMHGCPFCQRYCGAVRCPR